MKLVVEGYPYRKEDVEHILREFQPFEKDGYIRMNLVGYFYSREIKDCIFFLPKVVLDKHDLVFEKYSPTQLLDLTDSKEKDLITQDEYDFIYGLSVWIYRALCVFKADPRHANTDIVRSKVIPTIGNGGADVFNTFLDILLSLKRFNEENRDYFLFVLKNIHSGYNKINWTRTIAQNRTIIQRNTPVYIDVVNKRKQINFDEELLIIFFSILNYMNEHYGFRTKIAYGYELITGEAFQNYLDGFGITRLLQIKYKYFADKQLHLWYLCYAFFAQMQHIQADTKETDYLLVTDFNIVFEAIIDELLSDKNVETVLREHPDGKRLDHIYSYDGLLNSELNIYYIGDSKYYKMKNDIQGESIYKQYTYARNVIQHNIDIFLDNPTAVPGKDYLIYRDEETEGYNITPNFFIRGEITEKRDYEDSQLRFVRDERPNRHFENRLFDRDTLLLQTYNVNFLFVLALYAGENEMDKQSFRQEARRNFRQHIIDHLENQYQFFSLQKKTNNEKPLRQVIDRHFRNIIGKAFRPYDKNDLIYLSLEQGDNYVDKNMALLSSLSADFDIRNYKLGTDPRAEINHFVEIESQIARGIASTVHFKDLENEVFLIGAYRSDKEGHEQWIQEHKMYNIRYSAVRSNKVRHGAIQKTEVNGNAAAARFLILYDLNNPIQYNILRIKSHKKQTEQQMRKLGYPDPDGDYLVFEINEESLTFEPLNMSKIMEYRHIEIVEQARIQRTDSEKLEQDLRGAPFFMTGKTISNL